MSGPVCFLRDTKIAPKALQANPGSSWLTKDGMFHYLCKSTLSRVVAPVECSLCLGPGGAGDEKSILKADEIRLTRPFWDRSRSRLFDHDHVRLGFWCEACRLILSNVECVGILRWDEHPERDNM
jgi:hypothetical protein